MKHLAILAAILAASIPAVARADAWIHGSGNIWPQHANPPCSIRGQLIRCALGMRQQSNMTFKNKKTGAICRINVHRVALTFGDRWDVSPVSPRGPCTIESRGSNTFEIGEGK
ncbi:MAG TPA: hypothetical protein VFO29_03305 [Candidatus Rubrimentiphilum sp.]|nr:hypothetical protein [Candidatus Rubrimentiphilum sp.]